MKKHLIAFTLLSTPLLTAGYSDSGPQTNYASEEACTECGSCSCSCKPCCVPKPKKCIDCVCYTPAYYDLQCDWGLFFDAEFLYWYARETNLSYAAVQDFQVIEIRPDTGPGLNVLAQGNISSFENFKTNWEPGVRIGVGWNSDCDGWDTYLNWTYMRNSRSDSTSITFNNLFDVDPAQLVIGQVVTQGILNPWSPQNSDTTVFEKTSAKWSLTFNQIDLELGRKYWLSPCFTLRPFAGLRGAWIKTEFSLNNSNDELFIEGSNTANFVIQEKSVFENKSWGVGFSGGIQPNWHFCSNFILYSNLDAALLWGEFESKFTENYFKASGSISDGPDIINYQYKNTFFMMQTVLDLALGLRWEENWCSDRYRTALDLGWEHHVWFDMNHRNKTTIESGVSFNQPSNDSIEFNPTLQAAEATGNLMMGGLVVRLRFDF